MKMVQTKAKEENHTSTVAQHGQNSSMEPTGCLMLLCGHDHGIAPRTGGRKKVRRDFLAAATSCKCRKPDSAGLRAPGLPAFANCWRLGRRWRRRRRRCTAGWACHLLARLRAGPARRTAAAGVLALLRAHRCQAQLRPVQQREACGDRHARRLLSLQRCGKRLVRARSRVVMGARRQQPLS